MVFCIIEEQVKRVGNTQEILFSTIKYCSFLFAQGNC